MESLLFAHLDSDGDLVVGEAAVVFLERVIAVSVELSAGLDALLAAFQRFLSLGEQQPLYSAATLGIDGPYLPSCTGVFGESFFEAGFVLREPAELMIEGQNKSYLHTAQRINSRRTDSIRRSLFSRSCRPLLAKW